MANIKISELTAATTMNPTDVLPLVQTEGSKMVTRKGRTKPEKANPVKYANLVEYGTSRSPAKPFIRPAIESSQGAIIEGMANGYAKGMDKVIKKIRSRK
jgi:HK97 gp10 family phage protein